MRLFVAVNFDAETKSRLLAIQDELKKQAVRGNFSRPENLHLTLVFIGETGPEYARHSRVDEQIQHGLAPDKAAVSQGCGLASARPAGGGLVPAISTIIKNATPELNAFSVTFSQTGCFRHSGKELWWISTDGRAENGGGDVGLCALAELRRRIACGLETEGIPFDKRPFKAHITLGREIRPPAPIILPEVKLTVPVKRVSLMKSEHIGGTLTYTELFGCNLGTFILKKT